MQVIYTLTGKIPSKKNSRINTRSGRSFPSKAFMEWHSDAEKQIASQGLKKFKDPVCIQADFYFGDNIRRDLDNRITSLLDLFKDMEIIPDDSWQFVPEIKLTGQLDRKDPKTIIKIETL